MTQITKGDKDEKGDKMARMANSDKGDENGFCRNRSDSARLILISTDRLANRILQSTTLQTFVWGGYQLDFDDTGLCHKT